MALMEHFGVSRETVAMKYFPRYWYFVRGIHRSLVHCPPKGSVMQTPNSGGFGNLRRHDAHITSL